MKLITRFKIVFILLALAFATTSWGQIRTYCGNNTFISLVGGATEVATCAGDGQPNILNLRPSSFYMPFVFAVTNDQGLILQISYRLSLDFEPFPPGDYRIYTIYFKGPLVAKPGLNAFTDTLSLFCYGLSENFIRVSHKSPSASTVSANDNQTEVYVCPAQDPNAGIVSFSQNGGSTTNYQYLLTDANNVLIEAIAGNQYDFSQTANGNYRVWGFSFVGNFQGQPGLPIDQQDLASGCATLSSNFINVTIADPNGGTISLLGGADIALTCGNDPTAAQISLENTSSSPLPYAYLLTNPGNVILAVSADNTFDLSLAPAGKYRIWGLSYAGQLTAISGLNAATAPLSDGCFSLSDNFVELTVERISGGTIALSDGQEDAVICLNDPNQGTFTFNVTDAGAEQIAYLVTDTNNVVISTSSTATINLATTPGMINRVYSVAYSGELSVSAGDPVFSTPLASGCYGLSNNFVTITKKLPIGGTVQLLDASKNIVLCYGSVSSPPPVIAVNVGGQGEKYIFLLADRQNKVVTISLDGHFSLDNIQPGSYRIYGLAYTGSLSFASGADLTGTRFSDECYELSSDFITVSKVAVDGARISLNDGSTSGVLCADNEGPSRVVLANTALLPQSYAYLLTDVNNQVLQISTSNALDIAPQTEGELRVWGLAYTGTLLTQVGDNAGLTQHSSECFELSANFVSLSRQKIAGGQLSGPAETLFCREPGANNPLINFEKSGTNGSYALLITDTLNKLVRVESNMSFFLGNQFPPDFRVYGLAYTGNLLTTQGIDITQAALADECFELSENFVTLRWREVEGGVVSLSNGSTSYTTCLDNESDVVVFVNTSSAQGDTYRYFLTDAQNRILLPLVGNTIDLNVAAPGECRIWGVSFTGNLLLKSGDDITRATISDGCSSRSDNFISLTKLRLQPATIDFADRNNPAIVCKAGQPDVVSLKHSAVGTGTRFAYLITDTQNRILSITEADSYNVDLHSQDTLRIHGLTYSGNLQITTGIAATAQELTDECFVLSTNFLTVIKTDFKGGFVRLTDGTFSTFQCPTAGPIGDVLQFEAQGFVGDKYAFLITRNGRIEGITTTTAFDFNPLPEGTFTVLGLAYSGNLTATVGSLIDSGAPFSDDCFDLSSNSVTVIRQTPAGGTIALANGKTTTATCPGQSSATVTYRATGNVRGTTLFLITDTTNVIQSLTTQLSFNFNDLPQGLYRIWTLVYTGDFTGGTGDNAATTPLSNACYTLSSNFIAVSHQAPVGGTISADGAAASFCSGDSGSDIITFGKAGASAGPYTFLVADDRNRFLFDLADSARFDFNQMPGGILHVWGLAYRGELSLNPGDSIPAANLSTACFALSDNFIRIVRESVDGGRISSNFTGENLYVCPSDGIADLVTFSNTSQIANGNYRYVITNTSNLVLSILSGDSQNFDNTGLRELRVWGVSFTGDFALRAGVNILTTPASNACYDLSENYLTVFRETPTASQISTQSGQTSLRYCVSQEGPVLSLKNTSTSKAGFAYALTNASGEVILVSRTSTVNMANLSEGEYKIYGVSYTGELLIALGDTLPRNRPLASSCFQQASNVITVTRGGLAEGGRLTTPTGEEVFYACPQDGQGDIIFVNLPNIPENTDYRLIITDQNNRILFPDVETTLLDFDASPAGTYRIWGIAYTGVFNALFGGDIMAGNLATGCYDLSENFITIVSERPEAGTVATRDSLFTVNVLGGDGISDSLTFRKIGASPNTPYRYLLTDVNNNVLASSASGFEFDNLALGEYHVWGITYAGDLFDPVGKNVITSNTFGDNCYDFSTNFVTVKVRDDVPGIATPTRQRQFTAQDQPLRIPLSASPNPAIDHFTVLFTLPEALEFGSTAILQILNNAGQPVYNKRVAVQTGDNLIPFDLSGQQPGLYLIRVQYGSLSNTQKLIKANE
ncbi:MAG: T9SS type A sorting domain-containing protein [Lewinellaceae bacterium]|nr:T9SS type A sorting domain-containing protein [Lewinellaceae bacterium]